MTSDLTVVRDYRSIQHCVEALRAAGFEPDPDAPKGSTIPPVWRATDVTPSGQPRRVRILRGIRSYPHRCKVVRADGGPTGGMAA